MRPSIINLVGLFFLLYGSMTRAGPTLQLIIAGENRVVVVVDGKQISLSRTNPEYKGVRLIEANTDQAQFEIGGKEIILRTDTVVGPLFDEKAGSKKNQNNSAVLWADSNGFFFANGRINKRMIRFLIDTGATTVTLSSRQADQLGINHQKGRHGYTETASGYAEIRQITLAKISIENITLYNIKASVVLGDFPHQPLLGQNFLNRLSMIRTGNQMKLEKRH